MYSDIVIHHLIYLSLDRFMRNQEIYSGTDSPMLAYLACLVRIYVCACKLAGGELDHMKLLSLSGNCNSAGTILLPCRLRRIHSFLWLRYLSHCRLHTLEALLLRAMYLTCCLARIEWGVGAQQVSCVVRGNVGKSQSTSTATSPQIVAI